jgi:acylphosphatase
VKRAFRVRGRVQGVAYRAYAVRAGRTLGLRGGVRNEVDGSVVAWAEGSESEIARFREALAEGPRFARVEQIEELAFESAQGRAFDYEF